MVRSKHGCMRWHGDGYQTESSCKQYSLTRDVIDVRGGRRLRIVTAQIIRTLRVDRYENNVVRPVRKIDMEQDRYNNQDTGENDDFLLHGLLFTAEDAESAERQKAVCFPAASSCFAVNK